MPYQPSANVKQSNQYILKDQQAIKNLDDALLLLNRFRNEMYDLPEKLGGPTFKFSKDLTGNKLWNQAINDYKALRATLDLLSEAVKVEYMKTQQKTK